MQKLKRSSNRAYILIAIMIIAIICVAIIGGLSAKYIKEYYPVGNLKLSVKLNEEISLIEHKANRNADGSYSLLNTNVVDKNTYEVMPGVDIPKDPQIYLKDKTAVPAYMYVEIATDIPEEVTYSLTNNWIRLGDVIGPQGGKVYVYSKGSGVAEVIDNEDFPNAANIEIIKDNTLYVSDTAGVGDDFEMKIYGYLAQVVKANNGDIKDANTTFNEVFLP